jgi:hypothetical protein
VNKNKCLIQQIQWCSYIRLFLQWENPYITHRQIKYTTFNIFLKFCMSSLLISISSMFRQKQYKIHKVENKNYLEFFRTLLLWIEGQLSCLVFPSTPSQHWKHYGCYRETRFQMQKGLSLTKVFIFWNTRL